MSSTLIGKTGARGRRHSPTDGAQPRRDAPGGGLGAAAPTSLDTEGTTPPESANAHASGVSTKRHGRAAGKTWAPRAPEGRGARASWRRYAVRVAEELDALGSSGVAERLRLCGTSCDVRACHGCGDPYAAVSVLAGCDVRACVLCARRRASLETARIGAAADRVAGYVRTRLPASLARTRWELARRVSQVRHTDARERDIARLRRTEAELRGAMRGTWAWRMVTISPAWAPLDRASYTPASLAGRIKEVRAAWSRLWREHLGAGGFAAAYISIELSSRGHVHLHALHYGPFANQKALARAAGCMVDVRAAHGPGGVREVVKYALKGPSPRGAWMGGESSEVPHPKLAAAWCVATRSRRLHEPYGVMRDAVHAVDECEPVKDEPTDARCASCGSCDLGDAMRLSTAHVAFESRELARRTGRERWTLRAEVASRSPSAPPPLPARVTFRRP